MGVHLLFTNKRIAVSFLLFFPLMGDAGQKKEVLAGKITTTVTLQIVQVVNGSIIIDENNNINSTQKLVYTSSNTPGTTNIVFQ